MYQSFLNEYGKTHAKASTRKLNTHIRACVKDAIDEGLIRVDFTRGAVLTGRPGKKAEDKYLGYEESQKLLKVIHVLENKSLIHYLILLGLTSGMRYAEMMGLTRDDFNFKKNTINLNKTWCYLKKMHYGFGPTKTVESNRVIKMDKDTMKAFKSFSKNFQTTFTD